MASGVLTGTQMVRKKFIEKRIKSLTEGWMVTDAILKVGQTDALSIYYEPNDDGLNNFDNEEDVEEREEMGSYPRIGMSTEEKQKMIKDYGLETLISWKAIKHNLINNIDRAYIRLGNSLMKFVDNLGLNTLTDGYNTASTKINTQAAGASWADAVNSDPFADLLKARNKVDDKGYVADTIAAHPDDWTNALLNKDFRQELDDDVPQSDRIVRSGLLKGKVSGMVGIAARNIQPGYVWVGARQMVGDRQQNTDGVEADSYKANNATKSPTIVSSFREFEDVLTDPKAGCLLYVGA